MNTRFEEDFRARGFERICGVDEVGRGPLAGPVTVAAVVLPPSFDTAGIKDSKGLSQTEREVWYKKITSEALSWSVASCSPREIDEINILQATKRAMKRAISQLACKPDFILIDAINVDYPGVPQMGLIRGDATCPSIAAASIIAKVTRDRMMAELDGRFPGYGFSTNVGYGTAKHREALRRMGPCKIHRMSFLRSVVR